MPSAFVQGEDGAGDAAGTTITATFGVASTSGNQIVLAVAWTNAGITASVTDNKSNTYTSAKKQAFSANEDFIEVFYAENITGGGVPITVTATFSGAGGQFRRIEIHEVSGLATSGTLDKTAGATGNSTSPSAGSSGVLSQANEYCFTGFSAFANKTYTAGTGWTKRREQLEQLTMDRVVSATDAVTGDATFPTPAAQWAAALATFKEPSADTLFAQSVM